MVFLLFIPFLLIRFGLLSFLNASAVRRAAYFAPLEHTEKAAYWVYQLSNVAIFIIPFFLSVRVTPHPCFWAGAAVYLAGNVLLILSMINFAAPSESGVHRNGLYRVSRNPM